MDCDTIEFTGESSTTVGSSSEIKPAFKPGLRFYLAFSSLLIITLAAALDATSLSVALPVSSLFTQSPFMCT